ncbi:MAG: MBL fold metallo-hydrolase [Alphaproteobacteria bacterium]|nr:MBL fold metallo-hydrolase [Alphaproteobacteria bacterium]
MKLSFYGADRDVTGSCHMVECAGKRLLIDFGLHQGSRELDEENSHPFGFDAAGVDYVLLTHAHLDHCGRLPLLAKRGFRGEIITTAATAELAKLVMLDAANLQEEDARYRSRAGAHHLASAHPVAPLYTVPDALHCLDSFGRKVTYNQPVDLAGGVRATFINAGHILGSASVFLELSEKSRQSTVLFSGDLGKPAGLLLAGPAKPPHADNVVMETTYGDRQHKPLGPSIEEFYEAVTDTFMRGGNVVVPTFALERAQELLYVISQGIDSNRLLPSTKVFVDSPMAISATEVMERNLDDLQPDIADRIRNGHDPFHFPGLQFTREHAESMTLNNIRSGAIIMAGSGMCTGGRVRHHLKHNLWRPESSVVFVGYAANGTLARRIIDGAKEVDIFGEKVPVRARIWTINGFSAHADQVQLLNWHKETGADRTFLVHGEEKTMRSFAACLSDCRVDMPELNQAFEL